IILIIVGIAVVIGSIYFYGKSKSNVVVQNTDNNSSLTEVTKPEPPVATTTPTEDQSTEIDEIKSTTPPVTGPQKQKVITKSVSKTTVTAKTIAKIYNSNNTAGVVFGTSVTQPEKVTEPTLVVTPGTQPTQTLLFGYS